MAAFYKLDYLTFCDFITSFKRIDTINWMQVHGCLRFRNLENLLSAVIFYRNNSSLPCSTSDYYFDPGNMGLKYNFQGGGTV